MIRLRTERQVSQWVRQQVGQCGTDGDPADSVLSGEGHDGCALVSVGRPDVFELVPGESGGPATVAAALKQQPNGQRR
jgi:hypothetical protein